MRKFIKIFKILKYIKDRQTKSPLKKKCFKFFIQNCRYNMYLGLSAHNC